MPNKDGTGPQGDGPKTGGGNGKCRRKKDGKGDRRRRRDGSCRDVDTKDKDDKEDK